MIVVPAFASGHQRHEPIVLAVLFGVVIAISKHVRQAVDAPSDVPNDDGAQKYAPNQDACSKERCARDIRPRQGNCKSRANIDRALRQVEPQRTPRVLLDPHIERIPQDVTGVLVIVSAVVQIAIADHHPPNMTPQERHQRAVRIFLFITVRMVHAMRGRPARGRILKTAEGTEHECVLKPTWRIETAVR